MYVMTATNCCSSLYHSTLPDLKNTVTCIQEIFHDNQYSLNLDGWEIILTWLSSVEPFALHLGTTHVHQLVSDLLQEMLLYPTEQHASWAQNILFSPYNDGRVDSRIVWNKFLSYFSDSSFGRSWQMQSLCFLFHSHRTSRFGHGSY